MNTFAFTNTRDGRYIWNHQKQPSAMESEVVFAALQGHMHAGVFPTVPVKNNDHGMIYF